MNDMRTIALREKKKKSGALGRTFLPPSQIIAVDFHNSSFQVPSCYALLERKGEKEVVL